MPRIWELVVFGATPLALLAWCTFRARSLPFRVIFWIQLAVMGGSLAALLRHLIRTS